MPSSSSAAKRHRQSLKNRLRNRSYKSQLKTNAKSFLATISENDSEKAQSEYRTLSSMLDRAVSKGILHKNTAARKKSRMYKILNRQNRD